MKAMDNKEVSDLGGRPTKYLPAFCKQVYKLCLLGATDTEIAEFLEISESTLNEWKLKHTRFSESVRKGKLVADAEVAASFFKRATGYNFNEVTFEKIDSKSNLESIGFNELSKDVYKKKVVTKHLPPDAAAALNWLKNRQKDKWRDNKSIGVEFEKMTDDQLDLIIDGLKKSIIENEEPS